MNCIPFGSTAAGAMVDQIVLDNGEINVCVLTLGATLQDLRLGSVGPSLTLGSDTLEDYEASGALHYFGAICGPVANRIRDARTTLNGRELTFEPNGAGGHVLHGGAAGLHHKIWQVDAVSDTRVELSTTAVDGEGGFPGNRRWQAIFELGEGAVLTLTLRAHTDAPTLMNLANHSYWNLGREATFHGHQLQIDADRYLPADDDAIATGAIHDVDGDRMDFRQPRALTEADQLDTNFCLSENRAALRKVGSLTGPGGICMEIDTTEPGLQIYDCRHLAAEGVTGHDGRRYGPRGGLAIEAQYWPDAPSHPAFPSIRLDPGQPWEQVTRFRFSQT